MEADDVPLSSERLNYLISEREYTKALDLCVSSEVEIESNISSDDEQSHHATFYFIYMCLYILLAQYDAVRHLFHRLPTTLTGEAIFGALCEILKHLWNKRVPDALKILLDFPWPAEHSHLIAAVIDETRMTETRTISLVYKTMHTRELGARLALPTEAVISLCNKYGWAIDPNGAVALNPLVSTDALLMSRTNEFLNNSRWVEEVTEMVSFLEREPLTLQASVLTDAPVPSTPAASGSSEGFSNRPTAGQSMAVDH